MMKHLCYIGSYASFAMYLTRKLVDHRLSDDERRTVTDVEGYLKSRKPVELRYSLIRHLNADKHLPYLHLEVGHHYNVAFARGLTVVVERFFKAFEDRKSVW